MAVKVFDGQKDMVAAMHGFALGYLRHLRAFHFNESCSLADLLYRFIRMLFEDDYESLTKLTKLQWAYQTAVEHLEIKAQNDENLIVLDYFQREVDKMRENFDLFRNEVRTRLQEYRERVEAFMTKKRRIQSLVDTFMKNEDRQINRLNNTMSRLEDLC